MHVNVAGLLFVQDVRREGKHSQGSVVGELLVDDLVLDLDDGRRAAVAGPRVVVEGEDESSQSTEPPPGHKDAIFGTSSIHHRPKMGVHVLGLVSFLPEETDAALQE